jgi:hypothetical protein
MGFSGVHYGIQKQNEAIRDMWHKDSESRSFDRIRELEKENVELKKEISELRRENTDLKQRLKDFDSLAESSVDS